MYKILGILYPQRSMYTRNSYKRIEHDIQMEVINIRIRSLLESIANRLILSYCIRMKSTQSTIKVITTGNKVSRDSWDALNNETSIATTNISCNSRTNQEPQQLQMKNVMPWCNLHKVGSKKTMHEVDTCYRDSMGMM